MNPSVKNTEVGLHSVLSRLTEKRGATERRSVQTGPGMAPASVLPQGSVSRAPTFHVRNSSLYNILIVCGHQVRQAALIPLLLELQGKAYFSYLQRGY